MKRPSPNADGERQITRHNCHGLTLIEILVVVAILTIAGLIAVIVFLDWQKRSRLSWTRQEMRTLTVSIDMYCVEMSICPAWGIGHPGPGSVRSCNWDVSRKTGNRSGVANLPSFLLCDWSTSGGCFNTLTYGIGFTSTKGGRTYNVGSPGQPFSYIPSYPADRFCPDAGATFVYWGVFPGMPLPEATRTTGSTVGGFGFILVSPGPDARYDLPGSYSVYNPGVSQPSLLLLAGANPKGVAFTYDPTNGLVSSGDIWRVKQ